MSTHDVPGANAANRDALAVGAWAEHPDNKSLIFVKGVEGETVVYELFDLATPRVYTHVLPEPEFKRTYSYPPTGESKEQWVWHDKTPISAFPWPRVIEMLQRRPVGEVPVQSAAARVAEALNLRGEALAAERIAHMADTPEGPRSARSILERVISALEGMR